MPHHLAIHELVTDIAPYESSGWDELHAQQPVDCGTVSANQVFFRKSNEVYGNGVAEPYLPPVPEERNEACQRDRCMSGLQSGHELPGLSSAIRARRVGPCLGECVPAQTSVHVGQDDRQGSVNKKNLPR